MKRSLLVLATSAIIATSLVGCNQNSTSSSGTTAQTDLVVWHDNDDSMMKAIETTVNVALKDDHITIHFVKKAGVQEAVKLYGNDPSNGPDMFFEAHDGIGVFAQMGIAAPMSDILPDSFFDAFLPSTVEAGVYKNVRYFVPLYFESLLLIYNKDLWKGDIPNTSDELLSYCAANTNSETGMYGVLNQHAEPYNVAPIINGFGGYVINNDGEPGLNIKATKDAIAYNKRFSQYQSNGEYNTVTTLFNSKKAHGIVSGPWLMSSIKAAGINYGTKALSSITLPNGKPMCPYVGVQGFGVLKYAVETKKDAIAKVLNLVATKELGVSMANNFNCTPACSAAYDDPTVTANEMIKNTKDTIATSAIPMPNIPEMSVMWSPAGKLLTNVNLKGADIDTEADTQQAAAEAAIANMK